MSSERHRPVPRLRVWSYNPGYGLPDDNQGLHGVCDSESGSGQSEQPRVERQVSLCSSPWTSRAGVPMCMYEWWRQACQAKCHWHQDSHLPVWSSSPAASATSGPEAPRSLFESVPCVDSLGQPPGPSHLPTSRSGHSAERSPGPLQCTRAGSSFPHFGELHSRGCQEYQGQIQWDCCPCVCLPVLPGKFHLLLSRRFLENTSLPFSHPDQNSYNTHCFI